MQDFIFAISINTEKKLMPIVLLGLLVDGKMYIKLLKSMNIVQQNLKMARETISLQKVYLVLS
jgi:hypothetical protein